MATAFGAAALACNSAAVSAQEVCITEKEISALAIFLVPSLIEVVRDRCDGRIRNDGFLAREGDALAARYAGHREVVWPEAKSGFLKFGERDTKKERQAAEAIANTPDAELQPIIEAMIAEEAGSSIKPRDCERIERLVASLAPIEPEAAGNLIAVIVSFSGIDDLTVCPPGAS